MIYKVVDNFLDRSQCDELINEADDLTTNKIKSKFHENRLVMTCASLEFIELCDKSRIWKDLITKLMSQNFFDFCCDNLEINKKKFFLKNFFYKKNLKGFEKKAKKISNISLLMLPTISIIKFLVFRFFKYFEFNLFKIKYLFKKNIIELLFDYSIAGNGYKREIHRDSDERLIVFLLYLNDLDNNTEGGELEIYNYLKTNSKKINPTPSVNDCALIEKIKPSAGKLVIFKNDDTSFHAVREMKNSTTKRI